MVSTAILNSSGVLAAWLTYFMLRGEKTYQDTQTVLWKTLTYLSELLLITCFSILSS